MTDELHDHQKLIGPVYGEIMLDVLLNPNLMPLDKAFEFYEQLTIQQRLDADEHFKHLLEGGYEEPIQ